MKVSLNALLVLLTLVLVLKNNGAETSAASTLSPTSKSASPRSAIEERTKLSDCFEKRQCANAALSCAGCPPDDKSCADRCRQICECGCSGYQRDGMDLDLWRKCEGERECVEDFVHCMGGVGCSSVRGEGLNECKAKCLLANKKCSCECLLVTRAQASVAVAIPAVTACSTPEELQEKWDRCFSECDSAEEAFRSECGGSENKDWCMLVRQKNCACGCAGLPSTTPRCREIRWARSGPVSPPYLSTPCTTHIDHPDSRVECGGKCYTNEMACKQDLMSTEIERKDWCVAFYKKCECACVSGVAGNTAAAEYMTATEDREQLELCAFVRSCHTATCGCLEGNAECLSQCRDSCRCGCLRFPADGPDDRPAGGRLTVSQCRDKMDACTTSCEPGDIGCRNNCFLEREVCNCKCAGRSSGPPEKSPTDSEEKKINMYCNFLS